MRINVQIPSPLASLSSRAYKRAMVWVDDNSDWLLCMLIAIVVLAATLVVLGYLPEPQYWSR